MTTPPATPHDGETAALSPTPVPSSRRRRRRLWPRLLAALIGLAVAVLAVGALLTLTAGLHARKPLDGGRAALVKGQKALTSGNSTLAVAAFQQAQSDFAKAAADTSGGGAGLASKMPLIGNNLRVVNGVARAGIELSAAGGELADSLQQLPGGLGSLTPDGGSLPLADITSLGQNVTSAAQHAATAQGLIEATPTSMLVGPVADARFLADYEVARVADKLRAASDLLRALPSFAGVDGAKHYFLAAESPAELRGTGGLWGAWAILTVKQGRFSISRFTRTSALPEVAPDQIQPPPNPDYRRNYDAYGGAGFWRDLNMTPDFPSAARAVIASYEIVTGTRLDGVITADPFALKSLLTVTGPTQIPSIGVKLDAHNVVPFTTNRAYIRFGNDSTGRKEIVGAAAAAALHDFLTMKGHGTKRLKAIGSAVADGHLKIYSTDPTFQRGLEAAGVSGGLSVPPGDDLLSVVVNSRSGSKVDYYARRYVSYDVQLGGRHEAIATTRVKMQNDAPTRPIPGEVNVPLAKGRPGDEIQLVTLSCPGPCTLGSATLDGADVGLRVGSELGYPWYQEFLTIHGGQTSELTTVTKRSDVWKGNSSGGTYAVTYLNQTTPQPTELRIQIQTPSGTRVTWTSAKMNVDGNTASWIGEPSSNMRFVVRFSAPVPLRWWRNALHPFGF
jgi:hypothetical protein